MRINLNSAFTLIEILIVLVLIIFLSGLIGPRLLKRKPQEKLPAVLAEFNNLATFARQESMANQKVYRIFFSSVKNAPDFIELQTQVPDPDKAGEKKWEKLFSEYFDTKYVLPENIKMVSAYKGKEEVLENNRGKAYCQIVPNGLMEDMIVHLIKKTDDNQIKVTFKIFPFEGRFEMYDTFLRPGVKIYEK